MQTTPLPYRTNADGVRFGTFGSFWPSLGIATVGTDLFRDTEIHVRIQADDGVDREDDLANLRPAEQDAAEAIVAAALDHVRTMATPKQMLAIDPAGAGLVATIWYDFNGAYRG